MGSHLFHVSSCDFYIRNRFMNQWIIVSNITSEAKPTTKENIQYVTAADLEMINFSYFHMNFHMSNSTANKGMKVTRNKEHMLFMWIYCSSSVKVHIIPKHREIQTADHLYIEFEVKFNMVNYGMIT